VSESVLHRIARGDPGAVDECLEKYGGLLWSLTRRFSVAHAEAEDAVQEILMQIWRNAGRFDPSIASESTFVTLIARRRLIDRNRRAGRRIEPQALTAEPEAGTVEIPAWLELQDEARKARELMEQLKPAERQVLRMSVDEGLSQSEIAAATNLPLGTVKTHTRRGLYRLRSMLQAGQSREQTE